MKVSLLSHTGNPEKIIACAAKLCYSSSNIDELLNNLSDEQSSKFLNMLVNIGHESPIEHATFTFAIEGVSRALLAQITRHRIASFSVQSQRYVNENNFSFVTPPDIEQSEEAKNIFNDSMNKSLENYNKLADILTTKHKNSLIEEGYSEEEALKLAQKKAIEDARFVLPNACCTKMILTMNARSLNNFFTLRCCNRAQWEIRELAIEMLKLVYKVSPTLFKNSGPSCVHGKCGEGKMSCMKMQEVNEFFKELKANR